MATTTAKDRTLAELQGTGGKVELEADGGMVRASLTARAFSTGSIGYGWQGKVEGTDGRRFQVNITAVLIGSKDL